MLAIRNSAVASASRLGAISAFALRIVNAGYDRSTQAFAQQRADHLKVRAGRAELIGRADAKARLIGGLDDAMQHRIDPVDPPSAASQRTEMRRTLAHPVATHRRAIELPLVAECSVKALPSDPHRIDQHLGRATLESMLAEDVDRAIKRSVRVEFRGLAMSTI